MKNTTRLILIIISVTFSMLLLVPSHSSAFKFKILPQALQILKPYSQQVVSFNKVDSYSIDKASGLNIMTIIGLKDAQPVSVQILFNPNSLPATHKKALEFCEKVALLALSRGTAYQFSVVMQGAEYQPNQFATNLVQQGNAVCELQLK